MKKRVTFLLFASLIISTLGFSQERNIYQFKIYSIENEQQEEQLDLFLKDAYIPALNRLGIKHVGVFKPVEDEELAGRKVFVLVPFSDMGQFEKLDEKLKKDKTFQEKGSDYINAAFDKPGYSRIESIILKAFSSMPQYAVPSHKTPSSQQIYELRSYQASSEKLYQKKVEMFNEGGESKIFMDLDFQPVFFGEVLSGSAMPNLMYMTSFENRASQGERWKAFGTSPEWEKLKADKQYANTVSHIDKILLHPTSYSGL